MKKFILIFLLFLVVPVSAKEICRNPDTNLILDESNGIYSLRSNTGILVLGNLKKAKTFMSTANICFGMEMVKDKFGFGDGEYAVKTDKEGMYISKVGLGGVKVRPCDTSQFYIVLEGKVIETKAKKIFDIIME